MACPLLVLSGAACSDTTEPDFQFVASIRAMPDSAHLEVGETMEFGARPFDEWGNELPDRAERVEWSLFNPAVAELDVVESRASVTALAPGEASVHAELGRGQGSATIFVPPPGLDRIEVEPSPVRVSIRSSFRPRARLLDEDGAEMDPGGFRISWAITDTTVARVPSSYEPRYMTNVRGKVAGETRLKLVVGNRTYYEDVIVIPEPLPPAAPEITPLSATSLEIVWGQSFGIHDGYRVSRATSVDGTYTEIAAPGKGDGPFGQLETTYVDTGLDPGTTYHYTIQACNEPGCSEPSAPGSGTTLEEGAAAAVPSRTDAVGPAPPARPAPSSHHTPVVPPATGEYR